MRVVYGKQVAKQVERLDPTVRVRVQAAIDALADDPLPRGALPMVGGDGYRIRVGAWRVIYGIEGDEVRVVAVGHRRDVYR